MTEIPLPGQARRQAGTQAGTRAGTQAGKQEPETRIQESKHAWIHDGLASRQATKDANTRTWSSDTHASGDVYRQGNQARRQDGRHIGR